MSYTINAKLGANFLNIFLSKSRCIYENLAFEEWMFRNHNLNEKGDVLLIWRNSPAVVIGRYQNPWLEANVCYCQSNGIRLARRYSGGGAVYHDLGNINISILTSQESHARKSNLAKLATAINSAFKLIPPSHIAANSRDDLVVEPAGSKISGTAARIAHRRAYHHFTFLVNADLDAMRSALHSNLKDKIETTATRSVRAKSVGSLSQKIESGFSTGNLISGVKKCVVSSFSSQYEKSQINLWNGDFARFPGMEDTFKTLKSEEWVFGKTPNFRLKLLDSHMEDFRAIRVENGRIHESSNREFPVGEFFHRAFSRSRYSELSID